MNMQYTPAWAIETYLAIREKEREDKKEFDARSAERKSKMDLLETYLLGSMNERGEEQIKTSSGTAYKSPQMRVSMTDRAEVIQFVVEKILSISSALYAAEGVSGAFEDLLQEATPAFDLFTNHVNKEAVKALLDIKITPPGVSIETFVSCNVRKA